MNETELRKMMAGLTDRLERDGEKMDGLSVDDLRDALSHPAAAAEVLRTMQLEEESVKQGQPAPDFRLRTLAGDRVVQLSEEYRQRPVALIFGSYT